MSDSKPSKVFLFDDADPEMQQAYATARETFGHFWREVSWERRRIVPALDLACVKAPFSDGDGPRDDGNPEVEEMWMSEVGFDGRFVTGTLLNTPNWLETVAAGDSVGVPRGDMSDWMYAISGEVFGAHTVNLMRSRMDRAARRDHDAAWGLDFGDPAKIRLAPEPKKGGGLLKGWFAKADAGDGEHPMSAAMAPSLQEQLAGDPGRATAKDDEGWTLLHHEALAGNAATVEVLLEAGADPDAVTDGGMTALRLAKSLGWDKVVALLTR